MTKTNYLTTKELQFLLETVQHQGRNLGQDQALNDRFNRVLKKDITVGDAIGLIETSVNSITMNMMRYMEGGLLTLMENTQVHHLALQKLGLTPEELSNIAVEVMENNKEAEEAYRAEQEARMAKDPEEVPEDGSDNLTSDSPLKMAVVENTNSVDLSLKTDK